MHDTDHPNGQPPPPMVTKPMGYVHPADFEPVAFLIVAMNKEGRAFVNMPTEQPHLCLRLGTLALDYASQHAILRLQAGMKEQSPIVKVPPGLSIPPWQGPAGRG